MREAPCYVIAEAGVNHNGSIDLALQLARRAFESGANAVKFQSFVAELSISKGAPKPEYQLLSTKSSDSQLDLVKRLELDLGEFAVLQKYCSDIGIDFMSTAFDAPSIEMLSSLKINTWKVPSGEINNIPYLRRIGSFKKSVILSTGMANLGEIEFAINLLEQAGTTRDQITVLHCTTEYPAPFDEVNLLAMQTIAQAFGVAVGYSDHTDGIAVPIAAVAMGATVIEKHLTLDRRMEGPDHRASLEPDQFTAMVQGIRAIELALGDGIKRPTSSERANLSVVRKSIVAARPIQVGEPLTDENITAKRPGTGISPMYWDSVIGRKATRAYAQDELIEW